MINEVNQNLNIIEQHIKEAQKPYANYIQITKDLVWLNRWLLTDKPSRIKNLKTKIEQMLSPF